MKKSDVSIRKLKQLNPIVGRFGISLCLPRPRVSDFINEHRMAAALDRVWHYQRGLWLVRLLYNVGKEVGHVVLIDAARGIILDPAVQYAITCTVESLRACVGPNVQRLQIAEVLELFSKED